MNPEQLKEFLDKNLYYIIAAQVGFGLILGAIPLVIGIRRGKRQLGVAALVSSAVAGGISPLLGLIVAAVFLILVLRKSKVEAAPARTADNQSQTDQSF